MTDKSPKAKLISISKIFLNKDNPRIIKDEKFAKLVKSLKDFPEMAKVRPIVVNKDMVVLGGNLRLKAMKEAGWKDAPVEVVDWDEEKQKEFIIKDNVNFGEWDWNMIANEWDVEQVVEWGLYVPEFSPEVDYSILDDENLDEQLNDMAGGVKKAIQIEFEPEHYEEAYELVKFWREQDAYVGKMILDFLKAEKEKV
jgi:ParB-like chromosome segregation protein Spo0J